MCCSAFSTMWTFLIVISDMVDLIVDFEGNENVGEVSCCLVCISDTCSSTYAR